MKWNGQNQRQLTQNSVGSGMCFIIPPFSPSHLLKGTMYIWRSTDQRNWVLCLGYSGEQWEWFSENSISVLYFIGNEYFYANECNRNNHTVICSEGSFACLYSTSVCNLQEIFVCFPSANWGLNIAGKAMCWFEIHSSEGFVQPAWHYYECSDYPKGYTSRNHQSPRHEIKLH